MLKNNGFAVQGNAGEYAGGCHAVFQGVHPLCGSGYPGDFDDVLRNVLSGVTCLFIEGYEACIAIDAGTYPARSVEEPDKDKSLRGSRDGFVETIVFNTALMRRRIRDPHLVMEMTEVGDTSRTDVAICYMGDRVDQELPKYGAAAYQKHPDG